MLASDNNPPNVPVLVCGYNRPHHLRNILLRLENAGIRGVKVAIDGASDLHNRELVNETLQVARGFQPGTVGEIWFDGTDRGCGRGVFHAVSKFFDIHEYGIILEDDTLPSYQFFEFCHELLEKYKYDSRVGMISGTNHVPDVEFDTSYIFTRNKGAWGWASWKRVWEGFDIAVPEFDRAELEDVWMNMGWNREKAIRHWSASFDHIRNARVDAWDWQWYAWLARNNQLSITPAQNLIVNIGFGENATHTKGTPRREFLELGVVDFPLTHPASFAPRSAYELGFERTKYFFADQDGASLISKIYEKVPSALLNTLLAFLRVTRTLRFARRIISPEKLRK